MARRAPTGVRLANATRSGPVGRYTHALAVYYWRTKFLRTKEVVMTEGQIVHECGHVTAAKHYGVRAEVTHYSGLSPQTGFEPPLERLAKSDREGVLVILAAGKAATDLCKLQDNGWAQDLTDFTCRYGEPQTSWDCYVEKAKDVIRRSPKRFGALKSKLRQRVRYLSDGLLLSKGDVDRIWDESG